MLNNLFPENIERWKNTSFEHEMMVFGVVSTKSETPLVEFTLYWKVQAYRAECLRLALILDSAGAE